MDKIYQFLRVGALFLGLVTLAIVIGNLPPKKLLSPLSDINTAESTEFKKEVFGFAPYWKLGQLDNIDFDTITTLAYFGVPVESNGTLDKNHYAYKSLRDGKTTELFARARAHHAKVVLTLTQMTNGEIERFLDSSSSQERAINETTTLVKELGFDGVNIDFEYIGNPGEKYRKAFTEFAKNLTARLHGENPDFYVTVSVLASSAFEPKIYEIGELSKVTDGIFMMAYDYATYRATATMPTSPLFGYKEGQYWYDVSTAVEDFLKQMEAKKLILGLPWYGYEYPVYEPGVKTATHKGFSFKQKVRYKVKGKWVYRTRTVYSKLPVGVQTLSSVEEDINENSPNITHYKEGWDDLGFVGWKAYKKKNENYWRMVFIEDERSLAAKYEFAKSKDLQGVGIWALGYEGNNKKLWQQLNEKFSSKGANKLLAKKGSEFKIKIK